jgi:acetyltransferase-like isoleucine patch superfamily enzyme
VALHRLTGTVTINGPARPGLVLLGFGEIGVFDYKRSRSVWEVAGAVIFEGPARLGHGFKLVVAPTGTVRFGQGFVLSAESQLVARQGIGFGRDCLVSWDVLIIDTDYHGIATHGKEPSLSDAPIVFGDRVWLGARSCVLKGVALADDVIIGAGSVVTRSEPRSNVVLGGNPAKVIREEVRWVRS